MPSTYSYRLATPADDAELRGILRAVGIPGRMQLGSRREPDFFRAERIGSRDCQVIVCSEGDRRLVGFGVRSLRDAYVDGCVRRVAYLSTLRAIPAVRRGLVLARGYRYLRQLDHADPVEATVTTIYDDNRVARATLTSGRAGLPAYRPVGGLRTHAIPLRSRAGRVHGSRSGETSGPDAMAAALNRYNARWQFAPHWRAADFAREPGDATGPRLADIHWLPGPDGVRASLGVWDVSALRQSVVEAYAWPLNWYQPLSGLAERLGVGPRLPPPGGELRLLYACCLSADDDDLPGLRALLDDVVARWSGRGYDHLLLALPAGHPLEPVAAARARLTLRSTVHRVSWDTPGADVPRRLPLLEPATL